MHCLTHVNVNTPLNQFYDFCKVFVLKKAFPAICRLDIFQTCTDVPNSAVLSGVKCNSLSMCICIPVTGFYAIFVWYLSMLGCFIYLHIVKSTTCNQTCKGCFFLSFVLAVHVTFSIIMSFYLVALIRTLKWRIRISAHAINIQLKIL